MMENNNIENLEPSVQEETAAVSGMPAEASVPAAAAEDLSDPKTLRRKVCKIYNRTAGAGAIHFAILQTVATIVQVIITVLYVAKGNTPQDAAAYIMTSVIMLATNAIAYTAANPLGAVIGFAMCGNLKGSAKGMFSRSQIPVSAVLLSIPSLLGLQAVVSLLQAAFTSITGSSGMENMNTDMLMLSDNIAQNILVIAYIVIIGPIGEELLFRGMMLKNLGCINIVFGAVMSSVMFGLFHGNIMQFFTGLIVGTFFAYIDIKANSIIPSVIVHIANNLIAVVKSYVLGSAFEKTLETTMLIVTAAEFVIGGAFLFLLVKMLRKRETREGYFTPVYSYPDGDKKGYGLSLAVKAPCMWVFTAIFTVLIIINIVGGQAAK